MSKHGLCCEKWGRLGSRTQLHWSHQIQEGTEPESVIGASQTVGAARVIREDRTGKEDPCSVLVCASWDTRASSGLKGTLFNSMLEMEKPEDSDSGPTCHMTLGRKRNLSELQFSHL